MLEAQQAAHIQVDEWRLHKFQSPIELNHEDSIHHDHFDPLEFHGHWDDEEGEGVFNNNGFTGEYSSCEKKLLKQVKLVFLLTFEYYNGTSYSCQMPSP